MQSDEKAIRELVSTWLAATEEGNGEKLLSLMSDNVVFLVPGQLPMRKSDFAAAQAGLKNVRMQMSSEIQEVQVFGQWAYCWNKLSVVVTPPDGGKPVKREGNTLSILQKQSGNWKLVRDANLLTVVS